MALPTNQVPNFVNQAGMAFMGSTVVRNQVTDAGGTLVIKEVATYNYENPQYKVVVSITEK